MIAGRYGMNRKKIEPYVEEETQEDDRIYDDSPFFSDDRISDDGDHISALYPLAGLHLSSVLPSTHKQ